MNTTSLSVVIERVNQGDPDATNAFFELVYDKLHEMASSKLQQEREDHTLQTTALVNECYISVFGRKTQLNVKSTRHFYNLAARSMRLILVDHARRKGAVKRGRGHQIFSIDDLDIAEKVDGIDIEALDDCLTYLDEMDALASQVVHLKYFVGLTISGIAETLGCSEGTVKNNWNFARIWLYDKLTKEGKDHV